MKDNLIARRVISLLLLTVVLIPVIVHAQPLYYTVANRTSIALGSVTLSSSGNGTTITVGGSGDYITEVPGAVTSVTINGYTAYYPNTTSIVLPNGNPGSVTFTSSSRVEVLDLLDGM